MHHFYQFSLQYFINIFGKVLATVQRQPKARVDAVLRDLFSTAFRETSVSLLQKDRLTFAVLLAQAAPLPMDKTVIDLLIDEKLVVQDVSSSPDMKSRAITAASGLSTLRPAMSKIGDADMHRFCTEEEAEACTPGFDEEENVNDQALKRLLLVKLMRVDRLVPATERFVTTVFGAGFLDFNEDLGRIVRETTSNAPIALCASPGFDASYKVDQLVERTKTACANVAMGSNESIASADAALARAAANGTWVLIKNVHLAPDWLQNLVKRIDSVKPHIDFRLFLSMETSDKIPPSLLRASRVLMYEQPAGIRANMRDSLSSLPDRVLTQPVEKARVHFLLSYMHAVIQERLRYAPRLGWKKLWEFNDADYDCCAFILQWWIDNTGKGRSNVAPRSIPWKMLRVLVAEMYGGKVDDVGDMAELEALAAKTLTAEAFEDDFNLIGEVAGDSTVGMPLAVGTTKADFLQWVNGLPEREPPTYLGLPANAEKLLLVAHAEGMLKNMKRVMEVLDESEHVMAGVGE
ncbi:dynein heavy chain [Oleoguttula sp. CCFEE 5521]